MFCRPVFLIFVYLPYILFVYLFNLNVTTETETKIDWSSYEVSRWTNAAPVWLIECNSFVLNKLTCVYSLKFKKMICTVGECCPEDRSRHLQCSWGRFTNIQCQQTSAVEKLQKLLSYKIYTAFISSSQFHHCPRVSFTLPPDVSLNSTKTVGKHLFNTNKKDTRTTSTQVPLVSLL